MAGKGLSYTKWQKTSKRCFMTALSSAVLEWLLILMLLVNGAFAYLITWFARYCDLPIPCLLCSRLDHVFSSQGMRSYWDLMCKSHKSEISSLVLCSLHEKLVDVHGMCENCLFSYATKDKSNSETYRLLVSKIGLDPENDVDDSPLLGNHKHHSKSSKICCCCSEPWISISRTQALLHTKSVELEKDEADASLSREFRLNWSSSNKENVRPNVLAKISSVHESFEDCSPHFGYSELKLSSDTESEDREFELEEPKGFVLELKSIVSESTLLETPNLIDDYMKPQDTVSEKPIVPDVSVTKPLNLIDHEVSHSDLTESHQPLSTLPAVVGHGLEELNWQDIDLKTESSPSSDPISTDNVAELPNAADIQVDSSKVDHADSHEKVTEGPVEVERTAKPENIERINEAEKEQATTDVVDTKVNNDVNDGGVQSATNLDLGDAYKLAVSSRGRQLSGKTLEQLLGKDSTRVSEDLKLLLSQLSVARGGIISPRMSGNDYIGMQILQKRFSLERNDSRNSLERNESGFESLDVSIVSDVDGENEIDRLKRQIDHDKKFMSALYKELEEERSASAVAANQALAMITRLQEEKAALQMEALHDLRMMEDQAEYDVEALERANELLAEKEREIQDLEEELDYYRMKYPDELILEDEKPSLDPPHERSSPKSSWLGFEDERLYISQRLSNLEKKLHLFSNSGIYSDLQNGDCFNMDEEKEDDDDVVLQTNESTPLGSRRSLVRRVHSLKTPKSYTNQADMVTLGYELSTLNERLQALEADRNFLEHAINSLRNAEEGVRFLQEIASHLRDLRRVRIKRKQSLA